MSPAYCESGYCTQEWTATLAKKAGQHGADRLLPVRIADFQPSGLFAPIAYIDFVGADEAAARKKLLAGTSERRLKPVPLPPFPGATATRAKPPFPGPPSSPYPGLRPFKSDESRFFFGREDETDELMKKLSDPNCRFVAIVGTSGTGKSSLVYAGLLPRLTADASEGSAAWRVGSFKPGSFGNNPFLALAAALTPLLSKDTVIEPIDLANELESTPAKITDYVGKVVTEVSSAQLVLFVDQLEELFTQAQDAYRERFIDLLTRAAQHHRVRVLATLRAHFLHQVLRYPELAVRLQIGTLVLGPPGRPALAKMIRCPAERVDLKLEDELVEKILNDAGNDAGALPLVAFCLNELYRQTAHHYP